MTRRQIRERQKPKALTEVPLEQIDLVISLSPDKKDRRPALSTRTKLVHWPIPDAGRASGGHAAMHAVYRHLRDEIDKRVAALFLDYWRNSKA